MPVHLNQKGAIRNKELALKEMHKKLDHQKEVNQFYSQENHNIVLLLRNLPHNSALRKPLMALLFRGMEEKNQLENFKKFVVEKVGLGDRYHESLRQVNWKKLLEFKLPDQSREHWPEKTYHC